MAGEQKGGMKTFREIVDEELWNSHGQQMTDVIVRVLQVCADELDKREASTSPRHYPDATIWPDKPKP